MSKRCSELIAVSLSVLIATPPPAAFANTVAQAVQTAGGVTAPIVPLQLGAGMQTGLTTPALGNLSLGQALPSVSVFNAASMAAPRLSPAIPQAAAAAPVTAKPVAVVAPSLTPQAKAAPAVSQTAQPLSKQIQTVATQVQDTLDAAGPIAQARPESASGIGATLIRLLTGAREHEGYAAATPKARSSKTTAAVKPAAALEPSQGLNATQRKMLLALEQIASIYTEHYAPIEWKQKTFGADFVKEYEKIRQTVRSNPAITQREFHDMLAGFISTTRDYHTGIQFFSTERARLPMLIMSAEGKYFIAYIDRASLPEASFPYQPGDEVVEFDGKPVAETVRSLTRTPNTAETDARLAEMRLTNRIGQIGNAVPKGPVSLKIKDASGQIREAKLNWQYMPEMVPADVPVRDGGLMPHTPGEDAPVRRPATGLRELLSKLLPSMAHPHAEALSRMARDQADNKFMIGSRESFVPKLGKVLWEIPKESPIYAYVYEDAQGRKIGYIRIPDYMGEDQHTQIFAQLIAQFQKVTDGLVIDQVNNPGGSVFYMYSLLSMLTDKPLPVAKHRVIIDESDAYWAAGIIQKAMSGAAMMSAMKEDLKDLLSGFSPSASGMEAVLQYARFILSELKAGRRFTKPVHLFGMDEIPAHPMVRYTKPIMVLVNETDFSAGDFFPATLQDNGRAKIFGVRTAGAGGGVKSVEFPNQLGIAGFSYTWTIAERPNGQPIENLGVTPDIAYQITAKDLRTEFSGYKAAANAAMGSMLSALPQAGTAASPDQEPPYYPADEFARRPGSMMSAALLGLSALSAAVQPAQLALVLGLAALGAGLFVFNLIQAVKAFKQMKAMEQAYGRLMGDLKKLRK